jgi:hypothetical protein
MEEKLATIFGGAVSGLAIAQATAGKSAGNLI